MDFFDEAALRLKQQLRVTEDKQAAEALGMTGNAWTMRKRRNSFPTKELRALAQQRPELGIDVEYVLTGGTLSTHQRQAQRAAAAHVQALPGSPEDRQLFVDLLEQSGMEMAADNARRDAAYQQITEVLRLCSDDTVELALTLVVKLFRAESSEREQTKRLPRSDISPLAAYDE